MSSLSVDTLVQRGGDYAHDAAGVIDQATERLSDAVRTALQVLGGTPERARGAVVQLSARSREGYGEARGYLRDRPLVAIGAALAVGVLASLLVRRTTSKALAVAEEADATEAKPVARRRPARAKTAKPRTARKAAPRAKPA